MKFDIYTDDGANYRVQLSTGTLVIGQFESGFVGRENFVTMVRKDGSWVDLNPAHIVAIQVEA